MIKEMISMRYPFWFRVFHVVMLICILIEGCGKFFGIPNTEALHWLLAGIVVCILAVLNYGRVRSRLICGITLFVCFLVALWSTGLSQTYAFFISYTDWLFGREGWNIEWSSGYELIQVVLVVAGCYAFQMLAERYRVLNDVAAMMLLGGMIVSMLRNREISHFGAVFAFAYLVICYVERTQRTWEKKKERDRREYLLWLIPFLVLYVVLMLLMPAPEKPYDWRFVKDAYEKLQENFTVWIETKNRKGQEDFGAAKAGFSEDGRLMSGLIDNNQELLTIQGRQGLVTNVYLVGKVYDTFDGQQWLQTVTEDTEERMLDTLETMYAIERYEAEMKDNYIHSTGLSIRYEYFDTGCVFAPLKLRYIKGCEYQENGGNLLFGEQMGYGTSYQAVYYQMNLNHPKFYEMMEVEKEDDEEIWKRLVKTHVEKDEKRYTLEDLVIHRNRMAEIYHQELALSEEAEEYLSEITKDAETTIEKLIELEKELASYTYTMQPGKLPETIKSAEDFLDYFLLESKQGYCSYFATAFALMVRAEGIPARYVQGFCVPVTSNKKMTVTSNMAHAWPEVYIEGIGWLPFEPTPGYKELRYTPWEIREKKDYSSMSMEEEEEPETVQTEVTSEETGNEIDVEVDKRLGFMIWSGIVAVLVACIFVLCIDQWLFRRRYERMTVTERFLVEVRKNLWILTKLGYTRADTETLEELQNRVVCGLPQLFHEKQEIVFLRGYEEYLYRRREVQGDILMVAISEREELLQWVKSERQLYYYSLSIRVRFIR